MIENLKSALKPECVSFINKLLFKTHFEMSTKIVMDLSKVVDARTHENIEISSPKKN